MNKRYKSPVTIIIGIKCTDAIIVAADSRTTLPNGHVNDDAHKLHKIEFADGNSAIVGESGFAEYSSRTIEIMKHLAKARPFDDYRAAADCAQAAIVELKKQIREQNPGSSEEMVRYYEGHSFELLIAQYWRKKPEFFAVQFERGIPTICHNGYAAIGCGALLADFLISRLDLSGFDTASGVWNAVYAVEEIK